MARVSLQNLKKSFGHAVAVSDFSLEINEGELVAFLGPSGCGKTTTLRMIAGFIEPSAGRIEIDGVDVTNVPVHRRNTGMVFQRYALFPHMTVAQNISFGLEMHKVSAKERDSQISKVLDMVRMSALSDRYPRQLSGGQQQRVAIARALAIEPKVFLLDEPLSNLDAKLRLEVRDEIRSLQQQLGLTTIFVTHDQEEALAIADRLAIMHDGKVQQVGTSKNLYEKPDNLFVADFLGKMNLFKGNLSQATQFVTEAGLTLTTTPARSGATRLGVRPERVTLSAREAFTAPVPHPDCGGPLNRVPVTITALTYLGAHVDLVLTGPHNFRLGCQIPNTAASSDVDFKLGFEGLATFRAADCVLFSE